MIGVSHVLRVVVNTVAAAAVEVGVYRTSSSEERTDGVGRRPWQTAAGRDTHGTTPGEGSIESQVAADEQNSIAGARPEDTVAVHNHDLGVGCGSDITEGY